MADVYEYIKDDLIEASDVRIISSYLKMMIDHGESWPKHFVEDADVFSKNPRMVFDSSESPIFVIVKPKTEACGKTDGCVAGCWRITGRDKLIKHENTGMILGFKKIYKFCEKRRLREYKRSWIMEEYRVANKRNWRQDHVICKIRLMFRTDISFLLATHFSHTPLLEKQLFLPDYGVSLTDQEEEDAYYLQKIIDSDGNHWPSYVTNDVYGLDPFTLVDPSYDRKFTSHGVCFFANRTETNGKTDGCDGGSWRIWRGSRLIKSKTGKFQGFTRVFKFSGTETKYQYQYEYEDGEELVDVIWVLEEYRLVEKKKQDKVICVMKFYAPNPMVTIYRLVLLDFDHSEI